MATARLSRRSIRRDIILPMHYDDRLTEWATRRGVSRSEAVRQVLDAAEARGASIDHHQLRGLLQRQRVQLHFLDRLHLPEHQHAVRELARSIEEIERLLK